jgi:hypothetical protein
VELTPEEIAKRVADGHAFENHVLRQGQFKDETLGPVVPIETQEDLQKHVLDVLKSKETVCFTSFPTNDAWRHAEVFYHAPSNTMVVVPESKEHEATVYRPQEGRQWFDNKVNEAQQVEGAFLVVSSGMDEMRRVMEEDRAIAREEERLRKIAEEREERARKAREEGKGRSK